MPIPILSDDVKLISKLADKPNETNGLTADQLKARFDEAPNIIKNFINGTLVPALNENYISDTEATALLEALSATGDGEKLYGILSAIVAAVLLTKKASNVTEGIFPIDRGGTGNAEGKAASADKLNTNAGDSNTPVYFSGGKPVACTGLDLSTSGNAATATKLATARTFRTNLASTSTASFDGSGNVTPGVTGTLPLGRGGTGATAAAAALANLGGISITKLWENASIYGSTFAAQTISVDLSEYDYFMLVTYTTDNYIDGTWFVPKGGFRVYSNDYAGRCTQRAFTFSDTGLTVSAGNYFASGWNADNSILIPGKLYGIKGVR